jgi:hemoglobin-like flavoprotein
MNGTMVRTLFRHIFAFPTGLTERQQQLIRTSFAKILPVQETAAIVLYDRLFALDPRFRMLFNGDMNEQSRKLMTVMSAVIDQSHCLKRLVPVLRDLGRRYDSCRATDRDYDTVAAASIWTLEKVLGADFTVETREAWTTCYGILASEMKNAASEQKIPLLPPC